MVGEKKYFVSMPSPKQERDAQIVYAKALTSAIKSGILSVDSVGKWLKTQGTWSDEKEKLKLDLQIFLAEGQIMLESKRNSEGKNMKKAEAEALAWEMSNKRADLLNLLSEVSRYTEYTAEGMANNEKFSFLVSVCTKNEDGTRAFNSVEELDEETPLSLKAQEEFGILFSGLEPDFYKEFPESKFLIEYGYADDKLQPINKEADNKDETKEEAPPVFKTFLDE